jgi:hypothetical protein
MRRLRASRVLDDPSGTLDDRMQVYALSTYSAGMKHPIPYRAAAKRSVSRNKAGASTGIQSERCCCRTV